MMTPDRRAVLAGMTALGATAVLPARANGPEPFTGYVTLGDPDAAVQVYEYASLTCPHCAAFHEGAYEEFKAEYLETGKVGFQMREVYFDSAGLIASMVARCGGEEAYTPMIDAFLNQQGEWSRAGVDGIVEIGRLNGLTRAQIEACVTDRAFADTLVAQYQETATADEVRSTPTFVIRGPGGVDRFSGNMAYDEFKARIERALSAA